MDGMVTVERIDAMQGHEGASNRPKEPRRPFMTVHRHGPSSLTSFGPCDAPGGREGSKWPKELKASVSLSLALSITCPHEGLRKDQREWRKDWGRGSEPRERGRPSVPPSLCTGPFLEILYIFILAFVVSLVILGSFGDL